MLLFLLFFLLSVSAQCHSVFWGAWEEGAGRGELQPSPGCAFPELVGTSSSFALSFSSVPFPPPLFKLKAVKVKMFHACGSVLVQEVWSSPLHLWSQEGFLLQALTPCSCRGRNFSGKGLPSLQTQQLQVWSKSKRQISGKF